MDFAAIDSWAIVIAGVTGYAAGSIWYWSLGRAWTRAAGLSTTTPSGRPAPPHSPWPFVAALAADFVMATVLAAIVGAHGAGDVTLRAGLTTAFLIWLAFVFATLVVNYGFARRKPALLAIDSGHWLVVLVLMGGIIGGMGVK